MTHDQGTWKGWTWCPGRWRGIDNATSPRWLRKSVWTPNRRTRKWWVQPKSSAIFRPCLGPYGISKIANDIRYQCHSISWCSQIFSHIFTRISMNLQDISDSAGGPAGGKNGLGQGTLWMKFPNPAEKMLAEPESLPSGELTFCHGKSPFLMGKSTINGHFPLLC